jgi:hypothetical protein
MLLPRRARFYMFRLSFDREQRDKTSTPDTGDTAPRTQTDRQRQTQTHVHVPYRSAHRPQPRGQPGEPDTRIETRIETLRTHIQGTTRHHMPGSRQIVQGAEGERSWATRRQRMIRSEKTRKPRHPHRPPGCYGETLAPPGGAGHGDGVSRAIPIHGRLAGVVPRGASSSISVVSLPFLSSRRRSAARAARDARPVRRAVRRATRRDGACTDLEKLVAVRLPPVQVCLEARVAFPARRLTQ